MIRVTSLSLPSSAFAGPPPSELVSPDFGRACCECQRLPEGARASSRRPQPVPPPKRAGRRPSVRARGGRSVSLASSVFLCLCVCWVRLRSQLPWGPFGEESDKRSRNPRCASPRIGPSRACMCIAACCAQRRRDLTLRICSFAIALFGSVATCGLARRCRAILMLGSARSPWSSPSPSSCAFARSR